MATLANNRSLAFRYARELTDGHFTDLDALRTFRTLRAGGVLSALPFVAKPLHREEIEAAIKELQEHHYHRQSLQHAQALQQAAERLDTARLDQLLANPPTRYVIGEQASASELASGVLHTLAVGIEKGMKPMSQNLAPLDLVFYRNSIITIGADPGVGKSALGEELLLDLSSQGAMCLDLTIELDRDTKTYRYLQHYGGPSFSPKSFMEGKVDASRLGRVLKNFESVPGLAAGGANLPRPLIVDEQADTLDSVVHSINVFLERHKAYKDERKAQGLSDPGPPVVMVDFLQKIDVPSVGADQIYAKMNAISEKLYSMAKKLGIAMIWISQLRKKDRKAYASASTIEQQLPTLDDFEGTPRIGQLTHSALFLVKPKEGFDQNGLKKVYAYKPKVRIGATGLFEGMFDGPNLSYDFDAASISSRLSGL